MLVQHSEVTTTRRNQGPRRTSSVGGAPQNYLRDSSAGSVKATSFRSSEGSAMSSRDRIHSGRPGRGIEIQHRSQPRYQYEGGRGTPSAISARGNPIKLEATAETEAGHGQRMYGRRSRNSGGGAAQKETPCLRDSSASTVRVASSRALQETDMASGDRIQSGRRERGIRSQQMPKPRNEDGGRRGTLSAPSARRNLAKLEAATEAEEGGGLRISRRGSRRNTPLKAPRRESTLFDHLLMSNIKFEITPEQPISGDEPHPGDAGDGGEMRRTSVLAFDDFPLEAGTITIVPSTTISPPAPGRGSGVDGAAGRALGNGKGAKSGETRLTRQGYSQRRVAAGNDEAIRKPGKQRIGPRRKNLSVLKKRILLHRAAQWGHQMPSPSSEAKRTRGCSSAAPNGLQWVVNIRNLVKREDIQDEEEHVEIERDLKQMASEFGVVVRVEVPQAASLLGKPREEAVPVAVVFSDVEDAERAREGFHGIVVGGNTLEAEIAAGEGVEKLDNADAVLRDGGGGTDAVDTANEFATKDAKGFQACFPAAAAGSGSGGPLCCPNPPPAKGSRFGGSIGENKNISTCGPTAHRWLVAVKNLIDVEDNLEDDEEYAEICADAVKIVGACSRPISVNIPRPNGEGGPSAVGDIIATFASRAEAERCVAEMCGRCIGGKELFAELVDPPKNRGDAQSKANAGIIGEDAFANEWRVVVKNLIDQEDLAEDEDYAEVRSDVGAMASDYGCLSALHIPRNEAELGAEVGEAVAVFGSLEEARACARGLGSRTVGGKRLEAAVLIPRVKEEQRLEGDSGLSEGAMRPQHEAPFACQSEWKSLVGITQAEHSGGVAPLLLPGKGANESDGGGTPSRRFGGEGNSAEVETVAVAGTPAKTSIAMAGLSTSRQEKRFPDKYKEIIGLPRHPSSNGSKPRAYVTQRPDPEIDTLVFKMLQLLYTFQERARLADPVKAKAKQRLVLGLREVLRGIKARKVRLLILAPNVDAMGGKGGLDDKMTEIIDAAEERGIPLVFALSMRKIGKALGKSIKVSVVGIYGFDGANEQHKELSRRMESIRPSSTVLATADDSSSKSDEPSANRSRMSGDGNPT